MSEPRPTTRDVPRGSGWIVTQVLFFVGAALGLVFLQSMLPVAAVAVVAAIVTLAHGARELVGQPSRARRAAGVLAWIVLVLAHGLWAYLAIAWGSVLAWTIAGWGWAVLILELALVAATVRRPWRGVRVPLALPLGTWIALALLGWRVEEGLVRCDDVLALEPEVATLIAPTATELDRCRAGEVVAIGRFPRGAWESAEPGRLIVTTSVGLGSTARTSGRFTGSVCEVRGGLPPRCIGEGKAQGLAESVELDRIFIANWGGLGPGVRGRLLAISRRGPLEVLAETPTRGSLGELFYDPRADRVYGFTDEGFEMLPFVASSMEALAPAGAPLLPPGAVRYDTARGEGILCSASGPLTTLDGEPFMSVAARGSPFSLRPLGAGPLALATLTWGCDWDPVARRAWIAVPNLGLLATVDYDSGALLATHFVGFGMRSITHDPARGRLYLTNFLAGYVSALDRATMREVARWWVGRFPRTATLSRDGRSLFVGTNLGVIAIALDDAP